MMYKVVWNRIQACKLYIYTKVVFYQITNCVGFDSMDILNGVGSYAIFLRCRPLRIQQT